MVPLAVGHPEFAVDVAVIFNVDKPLFTEAIFDAVQPLASLAWMV
jgi:hypothetical protein